MGICQYTATLWGPWAWEIRRYTAVLQWAVGGSYSFSALPHCGGRGQWNSVNRLLHVPVHVYGPVDVPVPVRETNARCNARCAHVAHGLACVVL